MRCKRGVREKKEVHEEKRGTKKSWHLCEFPLALSIRLRHLQNFLFQDAPTPAEAFHFYFLLHQRYRHLMAFSCSRLMFQRVLFLASVYQFLDGQLINTTAPTRLDSKPLSSFPTTYFLLRQRGIFFGNSTEHSTLHFDLRYQTTISNPCRFSWLVLLSERR